MRSDQRVEVALLLVDELHQFLPLTFDDFELAVRLDLAEEVNHLRDR